MRKETAILDVHLKMYIYIYIYVYIHTQQTCCIYFQSFTPALPDETGWNQWHHQHSMCNHTIQLFSTAKALFALPPRGAAVVTFS